MLLSLRNFLSSLDKNADVLVRLSSKTTFENGYEMIDHCGNHYAKNWLEALDEIGSNALFIVKNIECDQYEEHCYDGTKNVRVQWTVTLENEKGWTTNLLDDKANSASLRNAMGW